MPNSKSKSPYRKFAALSDAQKEAVYRSLEDPEIASHSKPLSPKLRKLWRKAKGNGGRPRVGRGAKRVLLSIERGLLEQADSFAHRQGMTRSEVFSRGVKAVLAIAG
jgi:hypothetical protein